MQYLDNDELELVKHLFRAHAYPFNIQWKLLNTASRCSELTKRQGENSSSPQNSMQSLIQQTALFPLQPVQPQNFVKNSAKSQKFLDTDL